MRLSAYNWQAIAEGMASMVPGLGRLMFKGTQGTNSARYCYSVWMRHWLKLQATGPGKPLDLVVELGPGDSLGMGLAALLSGAGRYVAIDVVRHASMAQNLSVFEELLALFQGRSPIPGDDEFPDIKPRLDCYDFPENLLPRALTDTYWSPARLDRIRAALSGKGGDDALVRYVAPEQAPQVLGADSVDLIFSQAVLEHVDDLPGAYAFCWACLKPGGLMSHQVDFKSHGTSRLWNGHWVYPPPVWRLLRGARPYLINRQPCGDHLALLSKVGFAVRWLERFSQYSSLGLDELDRAYRAMSATDLETAGAFLIAEKPIE